MENIFEIIDSYSKKKELLDKEAIKKIVDTLLEINNVYFSYDLIIYGHFHPFENKHALAYFDYKSIKVYLTRLRKFLTDDESRKVSFLLEDELNEYEKYLFKNVYLFRILMHEMEHLLQFEEKMDNYTPIEKKLVGIERGFMQEVESFATNYKGDRLYRTIKLVELTKLYNDNDKISFVERISEIYAIEKTNDLLKDYIEKTEKIIDINNLFLLNAEMVPYINSRDVPTERFFVNIGKMNEFFSLDLTDLTYGERLRYGLLLEPKEFFDNKNELSLAMKRK